MCLAIHGLVGFKIVDGAADAPRPGSQCAPILRFARLALVAQANDAQVKPRSGVGLDAAGVESGVAPAPGENLLLPGGSGGTAARSCRRPSRCPCCCAQYGASRRGARRLVDDSRKRVKQKNRRCLGCRDTRRWGPRSCSSGATARGRTTPKSAPGGKAIRSVRRTVRQRRRCARRCGRSKATAPKLHDHRDRTLSIGRGHQGQVDMDEDVRVGRIVHHTGQMFGDDVDIPVLAGSCAGHFPFHIRNDFGHAPVDLAVEIFHDFRPPFVPPVRCRRDLLAIFQLQRVRQIRVRIGLGFVVVGECW